ncbi:MAG: Trk system potassium transporter TrkA [Rhodobacteraceae bacterium]|nr:Trk system potassium transporter TrkA [Paracoccaceae bacterium]
MKTIVLGAGQVGEQICRYLSREDCDVTVVDTNYNFVRRISEHLNLTGIVGHAADPSVLKNAGVNQAHLLVAVTSSDETNIVACLVARNLGSGARTIARLRNQNFLEGVMQEHGGPIDTVINPEREVAEAAVRLLDSPSLFDRRNILGNSAVLAGIRLSKNCPLLNTPLRQMSELFTDLAAVVVGYRRSGSLVAAASDDQLFAGDEVYVCMGKDDLERTLHLFGKESVPCSRLIIVGAGKVGIEISTLLDRQSRRTSVKFIEIDRKRAEFAAEFLERRVILNGDGLNREILEEAGINAADAILAVTQDDKTNLLVATRAKRLSESLTAVSLVNEPFLAPLIDQLSIDSMIDPRDTTVSSILPHIRMKQITRVGFIGDSEAELVEATIGAGSRISGKTIKNAGLTEGVMVGAVRKGDQVVKIQPDTRMREGDSVAFFALAGDVPELLNLLRPDEQSN